MADQSEGLTNSDLAHLRKAVRRSKVVVIGLGLVVFVLLVAVIAIGASHGHSIKKLRERAGLLAHPNVTFATQSGNRQVQGLTYGGSLFRGSGFWAAKPSLPVKLADHASVAFNESIYIIGGADEFSNVSSRVWRYDPVFHNYTEVAMMPEPRYRFGAAILGSKIYVVGGRNQDDNIDPDVSNSALVKSTFIYDIETDVWSKGADALEFQGDNCAAALDGKGMLQAVCLFFGDCYISSGRLSIGIDTRGALVTRTPFTESTLSSSLSVSGPILQSQIYLIGGYGLDYAFLKFNQAYDPVTNTWTRLADLPTGRGDLMCVALNGEVYVLGGYNNGFSDIVESFNPATGKWTTRPSLLTPRGDGAAIVLPGDRIMLIGGEGNYRDNLNLKYPKHVNEVYYASDETWVEKAMIPTARFRLAAAASGGIAFVFGGADMCINQKICPILGLTEVFLDVDHPHAYIYLKNEAYNDNASLNTYPL